MKKIKLIYNPHSGDKNFKRWLHECVWLFQGAGYETHVFASMEQGDIEAHIAEMPIGYYDAIAASGGDGTLNIVVNAMLANGHSMPLLVIPSGTANDFASFLKIPELPLDAAALINGPVIPCDVGMVNGRYFLNVCAAGILANVSQNVGKELKDSLGKLAYYLTALGKLANPVPLRMRITNSAGSFEEDIYLFLALNTSGTGGLSRLSSAASVNDGHFDFIIFKAMPVMDIAVVLLRLLAGEHLSDTNIIYFQDNYVKVEPLFDNDEYMNTDIDGESGPQLPITIENRHNAIKVFGELSKSN